MICSYVKHQIRPKSAISQASDQIDHVQADDPGWFGGQADESDIIAYMLKQGFLVSFHFG
jgi:hypothetical protein